MKQPDYITRFREKWDKNEFALESEDFDLGEYSDPDKLESFLTTLATEQFEAGKAAGREEATQYIARYSTRGNPPFEHMWNVNDGVLQAARNQKSI